VGARASVKAMAPTLRPELAGRAGSDGAVGGREELREGCSDGE
jgi:hypothetical protein